MCQLYFYLKKCGRKEKIVSRPVAGTTAMTEHCANDYRASLGGATTLSLQSRWRDKAVVPGVVARRGGTPQAKPNWVWGL